MAVRHGYGKIAGADALVFAYDTGDTRNSYKGEPTVNLTTDTPSQGGWDGTYQVLNSSTKAFRFIVSNFAANPGAGWRSFTWDLRAYTGQSVTISATVNVPAASPGTFAWILMGQGNTYTNNSGAGGYLGYSATSERVYKSSTVEEHITWSGIIGNSGTANQPSGHVGFTIWYNNGTPGINSYVEVSNVQIEIKSHATPFVNGTRSSTQGLLDLTGNSTINLANVSFDSNAKVVWDGTNDFISLENLTWGTGLTGVTLEFVVKSQANNKNLIKSDGNGILLHYNGAGFYLNSPDNNTSGYLGWNGKLSGGTGIYEHLIATWDGTTMKLYVNGVSTGTTLAYTAGTSGVLRNLTGVRIGDRFNDTQPWFNGDVLVTKVYNRALTAAEVLNNYNQYKGRFNL